MAPCDSEPRRLMGMPGTPLNVYYLVAFQVPWGCPPERSESTFRGTFAMADLPFLLFDSDNHYYEAEDAFTRHIDPRMKKRCMNWATLNGRKELLVAGKVNRFIPNPTFDPVARPGCLDDYYKGVNPEKKNIREAFGALEPIDPCYRDRDVRLEKMTDQRIEKAIYFPTLGVGMEEALKDDTEAVHSAFEDFNRWLVEDLSLIHI